MVREGRQVRTSPALYNSLKGLKLPKKKSAAQPVKIAADGKMRLNRFIAHCGICSRRDADQKIQDGEVFVNGKVVTELGVRIHPESDSVKVGNKVIKPQNFVYVLLNKPKNYITTNDDPEGRQTVMDLFRGQIHERIYPVGRLDRNTTGLLLFTNDGDLARKLMHPSSEIKKVYYVKLDRPLQPDHLQALRKGVMLEDGIARADKADFVEGSAYDEVGVELHSGRNRVVRRMFETLGYTIHGLDRTSYAFLSKKALPRGTWRHLTSKEVSFLQML